MITLGTSLAVVAIVGGVTLVLCGVMGILLTVGGAILESRHNR